MRRVHELRTGFPFSSWRIMRVAIASTDFMAVAVFSDMPSTRVSSLMLAAMSSGREPKVFSRVLASGFTSRRGMAMKRRSSRSS